MSNKVLNFSGAYNGSNNISRKLFLGYQEEQARNRGENLLNIQRGRSDRFWARHPQSSLGDKDVALKTQIAALCILLQLLLQEGSSVYHMGKQASLSLKGNNHQASKMHSLSQDVQGKGRALNVTSSTSSDRTLLHNGDSRATIKNADLGSRLEKPFIGMANHSVELLDSKILATCSDHSLQDQLVSQVYRFVNLGTKAFFSLALPVVSPLMFVESTHAEKVENNTENSPTFQKSEQYSKESSSIHSDGPTKNQQEEATEAFNHLDKAIKESHSAIFSSQDSEKELRLSQLVKKQLETIESMNRYLILRGEGGMPTPLCPYFKMVADLMELVKIFSESSNSFQESGLPTLEETFLLKRTTLLFNLLSEMKRLNQQEAISRELSFHIQSLSQRIEGMIDTLPVEDQCKVDATGAFFQKLHELREENQDCTASKKINPDELSPLFEKLLDDNIILAMTKKEEKTIQKLKTIKEALLVMRDLNHNLSTLTNSANLKEFAFPPVQAMTIFSAALKFISSFSEEDQEDALHQEYQLMHESLSKIQVELASRQTEEKVEEQKQ